MPPQIPCCHQGSNRTPVHLQHPTRDITVATRTISPRRGDREIAARRFVPTLSLATTKGKSMGSSNNHTNHSGGNGGKTPPPCTRIRATEDTLEDETIRTWADAAPKLNHPNQQAPRHIWNTSGFVHRLCTAWKPGLYSANIISINTTCKRYTHKISKIEHQGTRLPKQ
jgi:hypothetical protein